MVVKPTLIGAESTRWESVSADLQATDPTAGHSPFLGEHDLPARSPWTWGSNADILCKIGDALLDILVCNGAI